MYMLVVSLCASWMVPFDPQRTHKHPFRHTSTITVPCEMMEVDGNFRYYSTDSYEAVQIPYSSDHDNDLKVPPFEQL